MDYTFIIDELRAASLFDLFRLRAAITLQLEDPQRIEQVRGRLRPGMKISYFDEAQNRLIEARVRELHRTRLLVENQQDKKLWSIPFGAVNVDGVETDIRGVSAVVLQRLKKGAKVLDHSLAYAATWKRLITNFA